MTTAPQDSPPVDLRALTPAQRLLAVAEWIEDCEDHLALNRPNGLPAPPFGLDQAVAAVRRAAARQQRVDEINASEPTR